MHVGNPRQPTSNRTAFAAPTTRTLPQFPRSRPPTRHTPKAQVTGGLPCLALARARPPAEQRAKNDPWMRASAATNLYQPLLLQPTASSVMPASVCVTQEKDGNHLSFFSCTSIQQMQVSAGLDGPFFTVDQQY